MDRLIFPVTRNVKVGENKFERRVAFQTSIDYLRSQSDGTGRAAGMDDIEYGNVIPLVGHPDTKVPESARATVYVRDENTGDRIPVTATVRWTEFYPGEKQGFMWVKMPFHMLGKCAEAQARRKAFPLALAGLYLAEEMGVVQALSEPEQSKESTVQELPEHLRQEPAPHPDDFNAQRDQNKTPMGASSGSTQNVGDVRIALKKLLGDSCSGDFVAMEQTLKTVSYRQEGDNNAWLSIGELDKAPIAWVEEAYKKLQERVKR